MKAIQNNKGIVTAIIIVAVVMGIYKYFFKPADVVVDPTAIDAPAVGSDVLELNNSLQVVTLDPSIFSSAAYRGLVDFSVPIPVQPIGRKNPFNPIGVDAGFPQPLTASNSGR
ncbi:MAG: hypothetical protein JWN89_767 [Parcubacteria group bacterium]|nr:hypothetical protein [Parcubacteria group bacterium]